MTWVGVPGVHYGCGGGGGRAPLEPINWATVVVVVAAGLSAGTVYFALLMWAYG